MLLQMDLLTMRFVSFCESQLNGQIYFPGSSLPPQRYVVCAFPQPSNTSSLLVCEAITND